MNQTTALFLNVERLPDYDTTNYWFGLTISTALTDVNTAVAAHFHLKPWRWNKPDALKAFDGDGRPLILNPVPVMLDYAVDATGRPWSEDAVSPLKAALEAKYDILATDIRKLTYDAVGSAPEWTALLEDTLRLPAPLGQWIHLACVFKVDRQAGFPAAGRVYFAPVIATKADDSTLPVLYAPGQATPTTDEPPLQTITFDGTTHNFVAYSEGLHTDVLESSAPVLWLGKPNWGGKEWFSQLPKAVADAADVASRLCDSARFCGTPHEADRAAFESISNDNAVKLRLAVLRALRIGAHAGTVVDAMLDRDKLPSWETAELALDYVKSGLGIPDRDHHLPQPLEEILTDIRTYNIARDLEDANEPTLAARVIEWAKLLEPALGVRTPPFLKRVAVLQLAALPADNETNLKIALGESTATVRLLPVLDELDSLLGAVHDQEFLATLLARQWEEAVAGTPAHAQTLASVHNALVEALATLNLKNRLTLDRLGARWIKISARDGEGDNISALRKVFLAQAADWFSSYYLAADDPFQKLVTETAVKSIKRDSETLGPESNADDDELGQDSDTKSGHPLALVFGSVRGTTALAGAQDTSEIGRIAGHGVLLRQTDRNGDITNAPWSCLTLAETVLNDAGNTVVLPLGVNPLRVFESGGLETSMATYDNAPLSAAPIAKGFDKQIVQPQPDFEYPNDIEHRRWIQHGQVETVRVDGADMPFPMPALKFGQTYEAAAFKVTASGALPKTLVRGNGSPHPLSLAPGNFANPTNTLNPTRFRYLRRTPSGAPRLLNKSGKPGDALRLPVIQREDGVWPRAEELDSDRNTIGFAAPKTKEDEWKGHRLGELLLLVPNDASTWLNAPQRSAFTFNVRPPAVDLHTYHRWRAMDYFISGEASIQDEMIDVFDAFYSKAPQSAVVATKAKEDLTIDDPAIEWLLVSLVPLEPAGATIERLVPIPKAASSTGTRPLPHVQAPDCPVTITAHESAASIQTATWESIQIQVPRGQIYRLELSSLAKPEWYYDPQRSTRPDPARFRAQAPSIWTDRANNNTKYAVASSVEILIEVATQEIPTEDETWAAIGVLGQRGDELLIGLNPAANGTGSKFRFVKNVTFERQQWHWRGRRLADAFPFSESLFSDGFYGLEPRRPPVNIDAAWAAVRGWDGTGFGDRYDDDRLIVRGAVTAPPEGVAAPSPLHFGSALHVLHLHQNPQALYFRYQASVSSRYAGLMKIGASSRTTQWRRLVLKARPAQEVGPPKIRFLLPLTQPVEEEVQSESRRAASPALLILHETWGQQYGLAETVETEIVLAERRYGNGSTDPVTLGWEVGFDSIDNNRVLSQPVNNHILPPSTFAVEIDPNPIGLSFDPPGTLAPLPSTTSWIVQFHGTDAVRGVFVKLRFRKKLRLDATHLGETREAVAVDTRTLGPWVDTDWIQLLPNFDRFNLDEAGSNPAIAKELGLSISFGSTPELQLLRRIGEQRIAIHPDKPIDGSKRRRLIAIAITEVLKDAGGGGGRTESEVMLSLGLYRNGILTYFPQPTSELFQASRRYRARALEIEVHTGFQVDAGAYEITHPVGAGPIQWHDHPLFKALFPEPWHPETGKGYPDRAIARIAKAYPPIEDLAHS